MLLSTPGTCWACGVSNHICIDQTAFAACCGQHHAGCLHFPGTQFRLNEPGRGGQFFYKNVQLWLVVKTNP